MNAHDTPAELLTLPPECIIRIFELLSDPSVALRQLALVCRALRPFAQLILHRDVTILTRNQAKQWLDSTTRSNWRNYGLTVGESVNSRWTSGVKGLEIVESLMRESRGVRSLKLDGLKKHTLDCTILEGNTFEDLTELVLNVQIQSPRALDLPFKLAKLNLSNKFAFADAHLLSAIASTSRHRLTSLSLGVTGDLLSATLDQLAPCAANLRILSVANTSAQDHAPLSAFLKDCTRLEGLGAYALSEEIVECVPLSLRRLSFSPYTLGAVERVDQVLAPLLVRLELLQLRVKAREDLLEFEGGPELLAACEAAKLRVEFGFALGF